jgi:hypothetical protein
MKIKIALLFLFINSWIKIQSQVQKALAMPEYNILYQGYKNKVFPTSKDGIVLTPIAKSASIEEFEFEAETKGFIIVPKELGKLVVNFAVANQNGKIIGTDSIEYFVRPIPDPIVFTSSISKSTGSIITVGQSADSPISMEYNVIAIEVLGVNNGQCSGNIIPGKLVSEIDVGKLIGINVYVRNNSTGGTIIIPGALKVTD